VRITGAAHVDIGLHYRRLRCCDVPGSYPNGCKLYDNTSYDHNQVVQASWTFSNYPGYWYFYVRSPVSHAPDKSIFRFDVASDLSGSSSVGGWVS
jgi:hypothetical protein